MTKEEYVDEAMRLHWEKINMQLYNSGGVNPHAYNYGFKAGVKWLSSIQKPIKIKPADISEEDAQKFINEMKNIPFEFKPIETDAIEFSEWLVANYGRLDYDGVSLEANEWSSCDGTLYSTKKLYDIFKQENK